MLSNKKSAFAGAFFVAWAVIILSQVGSGAGLTHILHMIQHSNFFPSIIGFVVCWDYLLPVVLILLFALYQRENKKLNELVKLLFPLILSSGTITDQHHPQNAERDSNCVNKIEFLPQ